VNICTYTTSGWNNFRFSQRVVEKTLNLADNELEDDVIVQRNMRHIFTAHVICFLNLGLRYDTFVVGPIHLGDVDIIST
jgi:hypothetical protein